MYVALGVVGVLLVSLLIFGGMKLMTGGLSSSDEKTSEVQKKNYQELLRILQTTMMIYLQVPKENYWF